MVSFRNRLGSMQRSSSSPTTISAGDRQFADVVLEIVERGPRALKAARGMGRALRVVLGQMLGKFREAARILDRERHAARTVAVGLGHRGRAFALELLSASSREFL